jgi:trehalose-phosphatase
MACEYFFEKDVLKSGNSRSPFFLFLDFDGTLVPIRDNPKDCRLSDVVRHLLETLTTSKKVSIALLSGRSLSDIKQRVQIEGCYYGGCHGLEISGPRIRYIHPGARSAMPLIGAIRKNLEERIGRVEGVLLENKGLTLAVHYRMASKEGSGLVKKEFGEVMSENNASGLVAVMRGKKVFEVVPKVTWDKGKAALFILQRLRKSYTPIYAGDDLTDERAFNALNQSGVTVRVGKSKRTEARYYLKGQWEISKFLGYIESKVL